MRSPLPLRSADTPSPHHHHHRFDPHHHFHSTIALRKLRRFNFLILLLRLAAFCFSLVSAVFMLTNSRGSSSPHWYDFDAFRYVFAATAIVTIYSLFESGASVWEISVGATLLPEIVQVWFDFGHDQLFAYLLLSAASTAAETAKNMSGRDTCTVSNAFCVQSRIAIGLGFGGFLFLGSSSLLSGFRVVCFIINGTRFHI